MASGREHRRARLRRHRRVADLRLDGRRQGRARVGLALPRPRPRAARDPGQPRLGRAARDGRRARDPRVRAARATVAGAGAARLGHRGPGPVADTICFLLSDYARAISGEIVHVDGGFHADRRAPTQPEPGHPVALPRSTCGLVERWLADRAERSRLRAPRRGRRSRSRASWCASATRRRRPRRSSGASIALPDARAARVARGPAATGRGRGATRRVLVVAGVFFAADLILWHHSIDDVGAGLGDRARQHPGRARAAGGVGRAVRAARAAGARGAADRADRRAADLGRARARRLRPRPRARGRCSVSAPASPTSASCCCCGAAGRICGGRPVRCSTRRRRRPCCA